MFALTRHAVERFIQRWRPGASIQQAQAELNELLLSVENTHKRTLPGNAWLYVITTKDGQDIPLAVRDNTVITLLPRRTLEDEPEVVLSLLEESEQTRLYCRFLVQQDPPKSRKPTAEEERVKGERRQSALGLLRDHQKGRYFTVRAIRRAQETLGLKPGDPLPKV